LLETGLESAGPTQGGDVMSGVGAFGHRVVDTCDIPMD